MIFTKEDLLQATQEKIGKHKFVVVSNREPYEHYYLEGQISWRQTIGGMTMALDPIMRACGGTWIAWGSGEADRETSGSDNSLLVPPENPSYKLRRVWLSKQEEEGYYLGFANNCLWPLCHVVYVRPQFSFSDWRTYQEVNKKFAEAVLEELGQDTGFVFIQDYHLALVAQYIKEVRPDIITALFWHIPWPNPEIFRICPWAREILSGMLSNDLIGFHLNYHCHNFLDTVDNILEARCDREKMAVVRQNKETLVKSFPISIDFEEIQNIAKTTKDSSEKIRRQLRLENKIIGVGIDRIDYTKGLVEKFRAIERFLEKHPEYIGKFTFLQLGPISRILLESYRDYNDLLYHEVIRINEKYRTPNYQPIIFHKVSLTPQELVSYYSLADVLIISSLHDGMNLVAKEFVAARSDLNTALLLSKFTGASRQLTESVLINPYDTDEFAEAIYHAINMPPEEKTARMQKMRLEVQEHNVYHWGIKIISSLGRLI